MLKCFTFTFCLDVLRASNILGSLDSKYLVKLISYLIPVLQSSSRSRFVKCWRAKTDGWAASTFHSRCDGKGPTVTIIKVGSYIFGGYTDVSWSSKYQFMVTPFSLSLLFYSGVNVERSDLRIRCSPRQMCTNKLACLVKFERGSCETRKGLEQENKKNIGRGEGRGKLLRFSFVLFVRFCCMLSFVIAVVFVVFFPEAVGRFLELAGIEGKRLLCRLPTKEP